MNTTSVTIKRITKMWWPLAASWLLMSLEGPAINAIIARLADPTINLAAYGGVVMPIAYIIEAPIIMLLSASTALCKDFESYKKIWKFMMQVGAGLSVLHILVAFTPIYDFLAIQVLGVPAEIIEPARIGLRIMLPFSWAVGYRRFNQGVMIRFGYSSAVMNCTMLRLATLTIVLGSSFLFKNTSGVIVGTIAQALAVTVEGLYAGWRARPIIQNHLKNAPSANFSWKGFFQFYIPLMLTTLFGFLATPVTSACLSRMPQALDSLAVWGVLSGLLFIVRSFGLAYNEVVVALMDEKGSYPNLLKFAWLLLCGITVLVLLVILTPLASFWFRDISALSDSLAELAHSAFWIAAIGPILAVLQSWFQGSLMYGRRTSAITESLAIYLVSLVIILQVGVFVQTIPGVFVGMGAAMAAQALQVIWMGIRSRPVLRTVKQRDALAASSAPASAASGE